MNIDKSKMDGSGMSASADSNTAGMSGQIKPKRFRFPTITVYPRTARWAGVLMHWDKIEYDRHGKAKRLSGSRIPENGRRIEALPRMDDFTYYYGPADTRSRQMGRYGYGKGRGHL